MMMSFVTCNLCIKELFTFFSTILDMDLFPLIMFNISP